jgi:PAS domain S-box-containing protein
VKPLLSTNPLGRVCGLAGHNSSRRWKTACCALLICIVSQTRAQPTQLKSAPSGFLESGSPALNVLGAETLGLDRPATDMHLMPDGRILLYCTHQIVLGDGVRWQMFRQKPKTGTVPGTGVAVDSDGKIYVAIAGSFAEIRFDEAGQWEPIPVTKPGGLDTNRQAPRAVAAVGGQWIWYSGSSALVSWRPGQDPRLVGKADDLAGIFGFNDSVYVSDNSSGSLVRFADGKVQPVFATSPSQDNTITCAIPFGNRAMLVGTSAHGIRLFDGHTLLPFATKGTLSGAIRINDLCDAGNGTYAAAIENFGIAFFDHSGRVLQTVETTLDTRLSRISKLIPAPGGVIWGLTRGSVLRVEYPSRVSSYESLIGFDTRVSGHPYRLEGRLWLVADGKILKGVYDSDSRLIRLDSVNPPDEFVYEGSFDMARPILSTRNNAYFLTEAGWVPFAPGVINLRVLDSVSYSGRWLYGARGEVGWLRPTPSGIEVERIPVPELKNTYLGSKDSEGRIWMELGTGLIGLVRVENGRPAVEIFGEKDGVPDGWAQVFVLNGKARFNVADRILRFDEANRRFVLDQAFVRTLPGLHDIVGRPGIDPAGHLWITANGGVHVLESQSGVWRDLEVRMPSGFQPLYYTFESGGVVWMRGERLLLRYDPSVPLVEPAPLKAVITHVTLSASNRTLFAIEQGLPNLSSSDNSIIAYFVAPGNLYTEPVTFDVKLDGADPDWVQVGGAGSAIFNHLKEGHYVLRVRPHAGDQAGIEATLAFSVLPPWFRSTFAYVAYFATGLGTIVLAVWLSTVLQRRKSARLERLVEQRTKELNESNAQLAAQVADIRMLSQAVEQSPVSILITKPDGTIVFANPHVSSLSGFTLGELLGKNSRLLRSELVSPELIEEIRNTVGRGESWHGQLANRKKDGRVFHVRTTIAPIHGPDGGIPLQIQLEEDITEWLGDQERRRRLEDQLFQSQKLESLGTLAGGIAHDFNNILTGIIGYCELARLGAGDGSPVLADLEQIHVAGLRARDLVAQILTFSRRSVVMLEPLDLAIPVGEAMKLVQASTPTTIAITSRLEPGIVRADPTQIQQVVLNLCTNAVHAMRNQTGKLEVSTCRTTVGAALAAEASELEEGREYMQLTIADTGHGMDRPTLSRIFDPFFTTKRPGEGTGLGLAIVQGILSGHNGAVRVRSAPGKGTTFDLYFPLSEESPRKASPAGKIRRGADEEILLVDDEITVTDFAAKRLRLFGYRVNVFNDSSEALSAFDAEPSRYGAVVTDLTMPRMTGIELSRKIRASGSMIPIVIMTGYGRN